MSDKPRYYVPELNEVLWKDAKTLAALIYEMVNDKRVETPEFQALIRYYGREKLRQIYADEKKRREDG